MSNLTQLQHFYNGQAEYIAGQLSFLLRKKLCIQRQKQLQKYHRWALRETRKLNGLIKSHSIQETI